MSVRIMSRVWENGPPDPMQRLVLLAIADHADDHGRAYPSMIGLAVKCGMTERGVRGILRKLEAGGWLDTRVGGGRGGKSHYTVNPEPQTRNDKPGMTNPECGDPKTRNDTTLNPERGSAEPSRTIKEPSDSIPRETPETVLGQIAPAEAVASFLSYRRKSRHKALTLTGAKRLAKQLTIIAQTGLDPGDALGEAEERGWATVKAEWIAKQEKANGRRDGEAAERARRAGERWAARAMDLGPGRNSSGALFQPRLIAGSGGSGD